MNIYILSINREHGTSYEEFVLHSDAMEKIERQDEIIHQLQDGLQNLKIMKDKEIERLKADRDKWSTYAKEKDQALAPPNRPGER